jgi:mRNA-degrading endonuclease YafQ of YafQ-DinJ toxin-antitoxin module
MTVTFKTCKLFEKTISKAEQQIKKKLKDFINWKKDHPIEKFGSSDYPFKAGALTGYSHAKLSFDISIIYRYKDSVFYLYGVFSHDESGTGQPSNINRQASLLTKFKNQEFA